MVEAGHRVDRVMIVADEVAVVWGDGHESYYPGEALRKACTCAECQGEQHLFGRRTLPVLKPVAAGAYQPAAVHPVGNYGLQVVWGDGHGHGIYHLAALRNTCPCESCRAAR